jgi:hypothetical protein
LFGLFGVLATYDLTAHHDSLIFASPASLKSPAAHRPHTARATTSPSPTLASTPPASATASTRPASSPSATVTARELSPVSVVAFGPNGTSDGDNPDNASRVLTSGGGNPWTSSWYKTAYFGNLQAGTGLLLDMGSDVSVSSVQVVLGSSTGADVQLRLGDAAGTPADLSTVVDRTDVGGTVHLRLSKPERARYVLIWFTRLPPNSNPAGTFQIVVYSAEVSGQS